MCDYNNSNLEPGLVNRHTYTNSDYVRESVTTQYTFQKSADPPGVFVLLVGLTHPGTLLQSPPT